MRDGMPKGSYKCPSCGSTVTEHESCPYCWKKKQGKKSIDITEIDKFHGIELNLKAKEDEGVIDVTEIIDKYNRGEKLTTEEAVIYHDINFDEIHLGNKILNTKTGKVKKEPVTTCLIEVVRRNNLKVGDRILDENQELEITGFKRIEMINKFNSILICKNLTVNNEKVFTIDQHLYYNRIITTEVYPAKDFGEIDTLNQVLEGVEENVVILKKKDNDDKIRKDLETINMEEEPKFKTNCSHYEEIGKKGSGMAMRDMYGKHWCGDKGEFIEKCPENCERYDELIGIKI